MQKLAKSTGGEFKIKYLDIEYGREVTPVSTPALDEFLRSYVIEITPELKELVSTKGLASFRKGGKVSTNEQMDRLGFSNGGENIFSKLIDSIKEKVPASARLYYDKVIKQDKNPITEQDFTAKEYQEIKAHVKNTLMKDIKNGKIQFNNNGDAVYLRKTKDGRQATKPVISGYTKSDGADGQIPSFTNVFGNASYALRNDSYKDAVLTIEDVYDFNFEYGGGFDSETKYKRGSNVSFDDETPFLIRDTKEKAGILNPINRSKYISALKQVEPLQVVKGNLNSLRPIAERYAAFRLPDEKTAEKLQQEYAPVNVAVGVPISEIFNEEEWTSFINTPKPVSLRQESQPERLGFDNGGETSGPPKFEKRIARPDPEMFIKDPQSGNPQTHRMGWGDIEGQFIAYPTIIEQDGKLVQYGNNTETMKLMKKSGNFKAFDTKEKAKAYAEGNWKTDKFNKEYSK